MQRVAARQALQRQSATAQHTVLEYRIGSVARTRRVESAVLAQQRADEKRVAANQPRHEPARQMRCSPVVPRSATRVPQHDRPTRRRNVSSSAPNSRSAAAASISGGACTTRTTTSAAGKPSRCRCRNASRTTRFARLRSTARRSTRLATIRPRRVRPSAFGRAAHQSGPRRMRTSGSLSTASNSFLSSSRRSRPKADVEDHRPSLQPAVAKAQLDGKPFSTFGSTCAQHLAASLGCHPHPKAVAALAFDHARLVRPLHAVSSAVGFAGTRAVRCMWDAHASLLVKPMS